MSTKTYNHSVNPFILIVFIGLCVSAVLADDAKLPPSDATVRIQPLAEWDTIVEPENFRVSPDGLRYAYIALAGSRKIVVVDGRKSSQYTQIRTVPIEIQGQGGWPRSLRFTADSSKLVFVAKKEGKEYLVTVSRKKIVESPPYAAISKVLLSPSGGHVAAVGVLAIATATANSGNHHWGNKPAKLHVLLDGQISPAWSRIDSVSFLDNGEDLVYIANNNRVVVNNVAGPDLGKIHIPYVNAHPSGGVQILHENDQDLMVFTIHDDTGYRMAKQFPDGKIELGPASLTPFVPLVSADRTGFACVITADDGPNPTNSRQRLQKSTLVHIGKRTGAFKVSYDLGTSSRDKGLVGLSISPDGEHVGYIMMERRRSFRAYIDGRPGMEYFGVSRIIFSSDGKRSAYVAKTDGRTAFVVEGDEEYGPYKYGVKSLQFGPRDQLVYIAGFEKLEYAVMIDAKPGKHYRSIDEKTLRFHPDGERPMYTARTHRGDLYLLGDQEIPSKFVLSPDGQHFAYTQQNPMGDARQEDQTIPPGLHTFLDGKRLGTLPTPWGSFDAVRFTPDSQDVVGFAKGERTRDRTDTLTINGKLGFEFEGRLSTWHRGLQRFVSFVEGANVVTFIEKYGNTLARYTVDLGPLAEYVSNLENAKDKAGVKTLIKLPSKELEHWPLKHLFVTKDGFIFGTASGGKYKKGVVYRVKTDGTDFRVLYDFKKHVETRKGAQQVLLGPDDKIYGEQYGPHWNSPSHPESAYQIFRMNQDGSDFEVIASPHKNKYYVAPGTLLFAKDGNLYGFSNRSAYGQVWLRILEDGKESFKILNKDFRKGRWRPADGQDGYFYDASNKDIRRIKYDGTDATVLHKFAGIPDDGDSAAGRLVLRDDGFLYGLATYDGNKKCVLYRIKPNGSEYSIVRHYGETVVHDGLIDAGKRGLYVLNVRSVLRLVTTEEDEKTSIQVPPRIDYGGPMVLGPDGLFYGVSREGIYHVNLAHVEMPKLAIVVLDIPDSGKSWPVETLDPIQTKQLLTTGEKEGGH